MTTERIVTEYTADTRSFTSGTNRYARQLAAHERVVNRRLDQVDQRWARSARAIGRTTTALVGLGTAAAALSSYRELSEEWRGVARSLTAIGESGDAAEAALVNLAIRTRGEIGGTAAAVQRLAKSTGGDLDTTIRRVETLQKLLAFGGASGGERASTSLQLGQALQAGVLSGDEFKSISENAPAEFLDALAAAAGVARSELKAVAADQKLTTEVVLTALDDLADRADASFSQLAVSGEEAVAVVRAGLVSYVGQVDESLGATDALNGAMVGLGELLSGSGEGAQNLAASLSILSGAAVSLAGARGMGAVSKAFRDASAARQADVDAAKAGIAQSKTEIDVARQRLDAANAAQRAAYQRAEANGTLRASNTRLTAADKRQAAAAANLAAVHGKAAASATALTAAQARLSLATRVTTGAMRAFNGVMAFFGGPVGLAITAAGALAVAISRIPTEAEKLSSSLDLAREAANRFDSAMSGVASTDADLARAKNDMAAASATYRAAVADEATVAVATAQAEVSAINTRIDSLKELRATQLDTARLAKLDAQSALDDLTTPLRRAARSDLALRTRNGQAYRAPTDEEVTAEVDARLDAISSALRSGADLSDDDKAIARAAAEAQAVAAKIELLSDALERASAAEPAAVSPDPGGGLSDLLDGANLASRRLAALETQAARLRGALSEGGLDERTTAEAREALAGVEGAINSLRDSAEKSGSAGGGAIKVVDDGQLGSLQDALDLTQQLADQARTSGEGQESQAARIAEARALLVAQYGAESAQVAALDESLRRLGQTGSDAFGSLTNSAALLAAQGASVQDIMADILLQMLQMNGADAFTSLFSGGGGSGFLSAFLSGGQGFSGGGQVRGPGGPRDDRVRAWLSNGEFVVNADATSKNLQLLEAINANRVPAFANGGIVGGAAIPVAVPVPVAPSMVSAAQTSGQSLVINSAPIINMQGSGNTAADSAMVDNLRRGLRQDMNDLLDRQRREGRL